MHVEETDLKHVRCLIRLSEEKQFMKSLIFELFGDTLKSPINRKLEKNLELETHSLVFVYESKKISVVLTFTSLNTKHLFLIVIIYRLPIIDSG